MYDLGLLLSAVARPQVPFEGQDNYPSLFSKTAALFESLINKAPFIDGNKRTAITAAGLFLRINGFRLTASSPELEAFTLRCAQGQIQFEQMIQWFESHSEPLSS